jgi:RNA polymerase sigma-70 factor (ECF subfamily)
MCLNKNEHKIIEEWYTRYSSGILSYAFDIVDNLEDAKDILQSVFEKTILHYNTISKLNKNKRKSYLFQIAKNEAIDLLRSRKQLKGYIEEQKLCYGDELVNRYSAEIKAVTNNQLLLYIEAQTKLNNRDRLLINLKYEQGFKYKEISELLDIKEDYVSTYINRAKEKLVMIMQEMENENIK